MIDDETMETIKLNYPQATLGQLWKYFLLFEYEENIDKSTYDKIYFNVRFGYAIKFDINAYINHKINFIMDGKGLYTKFRGQVMLLSEIYTEIENRSQQLKKFLSENTYIENNKRILE